MTTLLRAVKFQNLDQARRVLEGVCLPASWGDIFDDDGGEPQGLLSLIPEDRVPEQIFYRLFGVGKGTLVEVEQIAYEGYGPPAAEEDYMGYVSEKRAYVLKGCSLPIRIRGCPCGARDIHHLEAQVVEKQHPLDRGRLAERLRLPPDWDFDELFHLIARGETTAQEIDRLIHEFAGQDG